MNTPRPQLHRPTSAAAVGQPLDGERRRFNQVLGACLAGWCGLPMQAAARAGGPQPLPIPLAMDAPESIDPNGFLVSEKLDGVRAVWDGHTLRFRSGLVIAAPTWFLQRLPAEPLDGELWLGRGQFEAVSGTVRRQQPQDEAWRQVRYCVFDLPRAPGGFAQRYATLERLLKRHGVDQLQPVRQQMLASRVELTALLDQVVAQGGEGLVLRGIQAPYVAGRSAQMLKLKPQQDAEATVLGHQPGQGRLAGRMGALRVRADDGRVFEIGTGFTDAQRQQPPAIGARITFRYRGTTEDGVPRFASFLRERPAGL